jgi:hypothetical protein
MSGLIRRQPETGIRGEEVVRRVSEVNPQYWLAVSGMLIAITRNLFSQNGIPVLRLYLMAG